MLNNLIISMGYKNSWDCHRVTCTMIADSKYIEYFSNSKQRFKKAFHPRPK